MNDPVTLRAQPAGRTTLVTGATFGMGLATALELARKGLIIAITGRDAARAQAAVETIRRETGNENVSYLLGDSFRPADVRTLAHEFSAQHDRLDILVNNAGGTFTDAGSAACF